MAPLKLNPLAVTAIPVPTLAEAKVPIAIELSTDTTSGETTPDKEAKSESKLATVVPSYSLLVANAPLMVSAF